MALEFMEGFDTFNTSQFSRRGYISGNFVVVNGSANTYQPSVGALGTQWNNGDFKIPLTARTEYYFGFDCIQNGTSLFAILDTTGATICTVTGSSVNNNIVTTFGNSANGTFPYSSWGNIQVYLLVSASAGMLTVKANGTQVLALTGLNTGTHSIGSALLSAPSTVNGTQYFDNVWVFNTLGTHSNTFPIGPMLIQPLFPNADGTYTNWTTSSGSTHYTRVNQNPADDDTTYNYDSTAGDVDSYLVTPLSGVISQVHAVQVGAVVRRENYVAKNMNLIAKSGSNFTKGINVMTPLYYQSQTMLLTDDPNTSAQWTQSGVNAMEIGVEISQSSFQYQSGVSRATITTGFVQGAGQFKAPCAGGDPAVLFSSDVTAGNTIFVASSSTQGVAGSVTVSDSQGNQYTFLGTSANSSTNVFLYSATVSATGSLTVYSTGTGCGYAEVSCMEMIGAIGTPTTATVTGTSTSGLSVSLTLPGPPYNSVVILCGVSIPSPDMPSVSDGTATVGNYHYQNGGGGTTFIGYQLVNSSSVTSSFNYSGGYSQVAMFAIAFPN